MISGIIAFAFGAFEALVLKGMLAAATSGNFRKQLLFLLIKFLSYGIAVALLLIFFFDRVLSCVIGYSVGLPVVTAAWFIFKTLNFKNSASGDDENENSNNN